MTWQAKPYLVAVALLAMPAARAYATAEVPRPAPAATPVEKIQPAAAPCGQPDLRRDDGDRAPAPPGTVRMVAPDPSDRFVQMIWTMP